MTVYRDSSSLKLLLGVTGLLCTSCCGLDCVLSENECSCFGANTPTQLIVTFSGVKRCSDDSLITELNKDHIITQSGGGCLYDGVTTTIDGIPVRVAWWGEVSPGKTLCSARTTSGARMYFCIESAVSGCEMSFTNPYAIGDCGNSTGFGGICGFHTVFGYGGTAVVTNPCA